MNFIGGTSQKERSLPDIPPYEYQFKSFGDILSGNFRTDLLISSGELLSCTIWDDHAIKLLTYYDQRVDSGPIIILTHARIKEPQGIFPASVSNSWNGSKLLINEDIVQVQNFKNSFGAIGLPEPSSQMLAQMTTSSQFSEEDRFMYNAQVNSFQYKCLDSDVTRRQFVYKLEIKVVHKKDSSNFIFWNRECEDLIGNSALKLRNKMLEEGEDDPNAYPEPLDKMLATTLAFRVRVQPSYNHSSVMKDVSKMDKGKSDVNEGDKANSDVNEGVKAKSDVNEDFQYDTQSLLATTDNDPDLAGSITPTKRLSAEMQFQETLSQDLASAQLSSRKKPKNIKTE